MAGFATSWQLVTPSRRRPDTCAEAKLQWASGFTSRNGFLSTGYQPVETRTTSVALSLPSTHITADCVHGLRPWWIPLKLLPPRPLPRVILSRWNYSSLVLALTLLVYVPVHTLCVLAGHPQELCSNRVKSAWAGRLRVPAADPSHPCMQTHTALQKVTVFSTTRKKKESIHHCFARKDHGKCGFAETLD